MPVAFFCVVAAILWLKQMFVKKQTIKRLEIERNSCYYNCNHFGLVINLGPTEWAGSLSADFFPFLLINSFGDNTG